MRLTKRQRDLLYHAACHDAWLVRGRCIALTLTGDRTAEARALEAQGLLRLPAGRDRSGMVRVTGAGIAAIRALGQVPDD